VAHDGCDGSLSIASVAILATVFGMLGRFAGRILTTTLGWAGVLLFGRVRKDRQVILAAITFGSVVWAALLVGVLVPDIGTFLLAFVPVPDFVDPLWVRIAMLVAAALLPLVVGGAILLLLDPADRPKGKDAVTLVLRGYLVTAALALTLVFLAVIGTVRKARVLAKRWSDAHIPAVVRPGSYERVVADLERALDDADLSVTSRDAPAVLAVPGRMLASVAGRYFSSLVPDRVKQLTGSGIEVLVHQSDIAISGGKSEVARARAAIASRLTSTAVYRTTSAEAQAIELRLEKLAHDPSHAFAELRSIDEELATIELDADEWEVLYRIRLQVERDLLTGRPVGTAPGPAGDTGPRRLPEPQPALVPSASLGFAAAIGALLLLDVVVTIRERIAGRT
jgi:hypothetical protein